MQQCLVIRNPKSGKVVSADFCSKIKKALKFHKYNSDILETDHPGHAKELIETSKDLDLIIVSGGDGTLNEAIQGAVVNSNARIAYIPTGTTNDVGRMHGYFGDVEDMIHQIMSGAFQNVDICDINGTPFIYVAGVGKFLDIAYDISSLEKQKHGYSAYFKKGLAEVAKKPTNYNIVYTVDGKKYDARCSILLVSNSTSIAGLPIYKGNNVVLDDGAFEVLIVDLKNRVDTLNKGISAIFKDITKSSGVIQFQTDNFGVKFLDAPDKNFCVDGEKLPYISDTYEFTTRGTVKMLLPQSSKRLFRQ